MSDKGYIRKVIRITAMDSPAVRLGLWQEANGVDPTGTLPDGSPVLPGVLSYPEYKRRRATWDPVRQTIGLDAQFYKGKEVLLFPPDRLDRAAALAERLAGSRVRRTGCALGVDPAEGGDSTCYTVIDRLGVVYQLAERTSDTNKIFTRVLALMQAYRVVPDRVVFDRGGGGKQHADRLRDKGYHVRTVGFGEAPTGPLMPRTTLADRRDDREDRTAYTNRRAEMYHKASLLFDPHGTFVPNGPEWDEQGLALDPDESCGFGLPEEYPELRRQLALMPLRYDGEGRIYLPPKDKRPGSNTECLKDLIGHSPDEADSFVCAVYGLFGDAETLHAGAY